MRRCCPTTASARNAARAPAPSRTRPTAPRWDASCAARRPTRSMPTATAGSAGCAAASRAAASRSISALPAAVSDQGRVHRRNEDAFRPRAGAGRGRRGRLRRHLHRRRPATPRRAPPPTRRAPCSPRPCATAPTSCARRRTRPTPRTGAVGRVPATVVPTLAVPSCTLVSAVCTERRDHGRLDRRQPRVLARRGRRAPAHSRRLVGRASRSPRACSATTRRHATARAHAITRWVGADAPDEPAADRRRARASRAACPVLRRAVELRARRRGPRRARLPRRSPAGQRRVAVARTPDRRRAGRGGRDNITVAVDRHAPAEEAAAMTRFTAETYQNEYLAVGRRPRSTRSSPSRRVGGSGAAAEPVGAAEIIIVDTSGSMPCRAARSSAAKQATAAAIDAIRDGVLFAVIAGTDVAPSRLSRPTGPLAVASPQTRPRRQARDRASCRPAAAPRSARGSRWPRELFERRRPGHPPRDPAHRRPEPARDAPSISTRSLERCEGRFQCDCRGVGTDWEVAELRRIASALLGTVDIVAEPERPGRRLPRDDRARDGEAARPTSRCGCGRRRARGRLRQAGRADDRGPHRPRAPRSAP